MITITELSDRVEVTIDSGSTFQLPTPNELRTRVLNSLAGKRAEVAEVVETSQFVYEPSVDSITGNEILCLTLILDAKHVEIAQNRSHPLVPELVALLAEECPDFEELRFSCLRNAQSRSSTREMPKKTKALLAERAFIKDLIQFLIKQNLLSDAIAEAAGSGDLDTVRQLLSRGLEVDCRTRAGCTPLMHAASGGQFDMLCTLIKEGANVNAVDDRHGMTPLMWCLAAKRKEKTYLSICTALLDAGADPLVVSNDGHTAISLAEERGSKRLRDLLIDNLGRG